MDSHRSSHRRLRAEVVVVGAVLAIALLITVPSVSAGPTKKVHSLVQHVVSDGIGNLTSQQALDIAELMLANREKLVEAETALRSAEASLAKGADVLKDGLCTFIGFCSSNPATSCQAIVSQPGVKHVDFPDGMYWIGPGEMDHRIPAPPPARVPCLFDNERNGWTLIFDDSLSNHVRQELYSDVLAFFHFQEMLAFTPKMLADGSAPVRQDVYYIDDTRPNTRGRTYNDLHNYPWAGQDGWAVEHSDGTLYPNGQEHFRYKYLGKIQSSSPWAATLWILDDGDVKDEACKASLDLSGCDSMYKCTAPSANSTRTITGKVPQMAFPPSRGVVSLGCSTSEYQFTQCGTCNYKGPDDDKQLADVIRSAIIRKLYAR